MSDVALRELERAASADPSDALARERLEDERVRQGFGWHGEVMPDGLAIGRERHVYDWRIAAGVTGIELVYAKAGGVACNHPISGQEQRHIEQMMIRGLNYTIGTCTTCGGSGLKKVAPLYVGRFPITWGEWRAFAMQSSSGGATAPEWATYGSRAAADSFRPVTHVSLEQAGEFCRWAALRIPTEDEWRWAALGPPRPCTAGADCTGHASGPYTPPAFPWGNERPSPERCVWLETHGPYGSEIHGGYGVDSAGHTDPVLIPKVKRDGHNMTMYFTGNIYVTETPTPVMVPARPAGASWCGALEMAGNVNEWVTSGTRVYDAIGGSYRDHMIPSLWPLRGDHAGMSLERSQGYDDVGFRVALSA